MAQVGRYQVGIPRRGVYKPIVASWSLQEACMRPTGESTKPSFNDFIHVSP